MKILEIGYLMPDDEYHKNKALSFAAGRFEKGLLGGLEKIQDCDLQICAIEPQVRKFPHGKFWVKSKTYCVEGIRTPVSTVGYINIPFLKHLCLFGGLLRRIYSWHKKSTGDSKVILSYNADVPTPQVGRIAKNFGCLYAPILLDLPFYDEINSKKTFGNMLSKLGYKSQFSNLRKLDTAIVLNENSATDFGIKNYLIVEGAVTDQEIETNMHYCPKVDIKELNILYCGALDEFHGTPILVEIAKKMPNVNILIAGRGEKFSKILRQSDIKNLKYYGEITNEELIDLQHNADLLIIPHPSTLNQLRYQFPSKLMTCMATGIPVLVTPIPGILNEYSSYLMKAKSDSLDDVCHEIQRFMKLDADSKRSMGESARDFVIKNKNWDVQCQRIMHFLKEQTNEAQT